MGRGRHSRRRKNKQRDKQLLLDESRRDSAEAKKALREEKRQMKWGGNMHDNGRKNEPAFTTLAIQWSLLKASGSREALDKLREFYIRGKLHSLIFIAGSNVSSDEMIAARRWLNSIGHDWVYGHTTFNTSRLEKPDNFVYRILQTFDVDSFVFAKTDIKENNWIRAVIKTLRMHPFESWDGTTEWITRLNSRYYVPAEPVPEAIEIINTKPKMIVAQVISKE